MFKERRKNDQTNSYKLCNFNQHCGLPAHVFLRHVVGFLGLLTQRARHRQQRRAAAGAENVFYRL